MASSGSRTSVFESILEHLDWLIEMRLQFDDEVESKLNRLMLELKDDVRVLLPFDLYITNCWKNQEMCWEPDLEEKGNTKSDSSRLSIMLSKIQDLARTIVPGPESAVFTYMQSLGSNHSDIKTKLTTFKEKIRLFFETEIQSSCIISLLHHCSLGDPRLVTNLIDSVLESLEWVGCWIGELHKAPSIEMRTLEAKLSFLKSFICFATVQGIEGKQLMDLLFHAEVVAVKAARLISICWFDRESKQMCNEVEFQISQLIRKEIDPVDPQVRETYIRVLTASKLSRSSHTLVLEKNKHLLAKFIDCLLYNAMELLEHFPSFSVLMKDQMLILHEGVRFLRNLFGQQQEKFDGLHDQMKDLIGFVACDAGIVILSLSATEMNEGLAKETDLALFHLVKVLKFIMAEFAQIYPPPSFCFPWTNELGCFDFLLESLQDLSNSEADSIDFPKNHIDRVQEDLTFLRSLLKNIVGQRNQNVKLQALWNRGMEVAYKAKLLINSIVFGDKSECLDTLAGDIELMRTEALGICDSLGHGTDTQRVTTNSADTTSKLRTPALNEAPVGLDEAVKIIINRLTRSSKQLDIVSIVGMGGLGKTTLANTVYNRMQNSVCRHFHIHAWCTVSQAYSKHNLLAQILCSIHHGSPGEYLNKDEDDLAEELRRVLLRNRYLIVLDDLWDIEAWNLLERSFPNDLSGSRILLTSRIHSLPLQLKHDSEPYHLHQLTDKESWTLLQNKLFGKEGCCPPTLNEVGFQIAKNCKGLPLTIVLVAGILATTEHDCWKEVAETLSSSTIVETEQCKMTLELSYSNLPGHLKPCLLYFGAFPEDEDVPVRKLIWLWSSEGFLQKTEGKSLEDVVDEYLTDLLQRSLVMVTRQRSIGGAKACRIHDLIHEFCVEKAKEESFLQISRGKNDLLTLTGPHNLHRLCIYNTGLEKLKKSKVFFPDLRSLLFFDKWDGLRYLPIGVLPFRLLRVLDFGCFSFLYGFPMEVVLLVHLRCLVISSIGSVPSEIANLSRLETLLVMACRRNVGLPTTIWNIQTLRHLCIAHSCFGFSFPADSLDGCPDLKHLETLSLAIDSSSQSLQKILTKLPSIRRLKCVPCIEDSSSSRNWILVLDGLSRLESLKVDFRAPLEIKFPLYLKKLTLSCTRMPWTEISTIGKLPSLEALKLRHEAFVGEKWEMKAGEFLNLRFLELSSLDLRSWTATSDNFSRLEKLVVERCWKLEEVPSSCLGECLTLEMIELKWCCKSAATSVKQIQEEQVDMGNVDLRVILEDLVDSSEAESCDYADLSDSSEAELN
ncbi:putative late blight resistance protein homolog R1A-3 [Coffea arabica]|uniref:Late blight resistance protein homolog R1A-3 n=1 Tax=Coffea arabica TaxID=13443 RepID=A0A6P6TD20_COFAR|nr:putative late blight resistance protein homolog R1A-3 [Coffea arabica]